jgi:hypothetical protein
VADTVVVRCPRCDRRGKVHCKLKACTWFRCAHCSVPGGRDHAPWSYLWDAFTGFVSAPPAELRHGG